MFTIHYSIVYIIQCAIYSRYAMYSVYQYARTFFAGTFLIITHVINNHDVLCLFTVSMATIHLQEICMLKFKLALLHVVMGNRIYRKRIDTIYYTLYNTRHYIRVQCTHINTHSHLPIYAFNALTHALLCLNAKMLISLNGHLSA